VSSEFRAEFTDYVTSRFEWFTRGRCVHCLSFYLLILLISEPGHPLEARILDYLTSGIHADIAIATVPSTNLHEYRVVGFEMEGVRISLSWLSHGKCGEHELIRRLYYVLRMVSSRRISPSIAAKVDRLSDLWQLSGQSQTTVQGYTTQNNRNMIPLQVHSHVSHYLNESDSRTESESTESESSLRLRFLGVGMALHPRSYSEIVSVCTFDPSHATNETLSRYYRSTLESFHADGMSDAASSFDGISKKRTPDSAFEGTRADFERCRDGVLEEIWANDRCQLDSWQQLYLSTSVKLYFKTFWGIIPTGGVCGGSEADNSESSEMWETSESSSLSH
jgi:hypothetical protein